MTLAMKIHDAYAKGHNEIIDESLISYYDMVSKDIPISMVLPYAEKFGVTDESDFRNKAFLAGYDLSKF